MSPKWLAGIENRTIHMAVKIYLWKEKNTAVRRKLVESFKLADK